METAAVYYESKIKTYGFHETGDLTLFEIEIKQARMAEWGKCIAGLENLKIQFSLVLFQNQTHNRLRFYLLLDHRWESDIQHHFRDFIEKDDQAAIKIKSPVELVYFHGPHYGDRYGIVYYVLNTLAENKIPVIICACSGAAIYIVIPYNHLKKIRPILTEAFEIPKSIDDSVRYGKR